MSNYIASCNQYYIYNVAVVAGLYLSIKAILQRYLATALLFKTRLVVREIGQRSLPLIPAKQDFNQQYNKWVE